MSGNLTAEGGHRPLPRPKGLSARTSALNWPQPCLLVLGCCVNLRSQASGRLSETSWPCFSEGACGEILVQRPPVVGLGMGLRKSALRPYTVPYARTTYNAGQRMLISVYGDLFDVSEPFLRKTFQHFQTSWTSMSIPCHQDRPDKYGADGPYWTLVVIDLCCCMQFMVVRSMYRLSAAARYMTGKDITWALMSGEEQRWLPALAFADTT